MNERIESNHFGVVGVVGVVGGVVGGARQFLIVSGN